MISIETLIKEDSSKLLEYTPVPLNDKEKYYIRIPSSVILDTDLNTKRISVFSFLLFRKGYDDIVTLSLNSLIRECGYTPRKGLSEINKQFKDLITMFAIEDENRLTGGYLTLSDEITNTTYVNLTFNSDKLKHQCDKEEHYAVIYLDEYQKILSYKFNNKKDTSINVSVLLLVFAYLRLKIICRTNVFRYQDRFESIQEKKEKYPDAFNCKYKEIAEHIGITPRSLSKAVNILNELGLIYKEPVERMQLDDGSWVTNDTIFVNMYKREFNNLLAYGEEYYLTEVKNKRNLIPMNYGCKRK